MCGIAGLIDISRSTPTAELRASVEQMANALVHRGPDDSDVWTAADVGVGLGHRRLSIIDLSPAGHQPMTSASGRYVITYNGEVYNFPVLREELLRAGHHFRGHSDTEILLTAVEEWGLFPALQRLVGQFALALWDRQEQVMHLVRDRIGEKPLYYARVGKRILFASELKALLRHPSWEGDVVRAALSTYLRHSYVPAPHCIYQNTYKLLPGTVLSISRDGELGEPLPYWALSDVVERGMSERLSLSDSEATDALDSLLREVVAEKMVADVPLGAFLSGGIDSSTIVALMQAQHTRPVNTFSIGFDEADYDEAVYAKGVAAHLGTNHVELYVTPREAREVIPSLPQYYDEPFADSSQIPTFLVSQLAREHVTVSLSGDAGDELFGGYNRYLFGRSLWHKLRWSPQALRAMAARSITLATPEAWNTVSGLIKFLSFSKIRLIRFGDRMHKLAQILPSESPEGLYHWLVSHWQNPDAVVRGGSEASTLLTSSKNWARLDDFTERMMYLDALTYLPDDILVKVDRASMAVSLEARVPLLDHRVVEFAWRLPLKFKIRNGESKWLLRRVLERYVPRSLTDRPKMGFGIPLDSWLRGPLRDWCESLLSEDRLRNEGYFHPEPIRKKWREHLSGKLNWQYHLWNVLMFQSWLESIETSSQQSAG